MAGLILLLMLVVACATSPTVTRGSETTLKIIEWGWGTPEPVYIRDHVREMEQLPFDGLGLDLPADGKPPDTGSKFSWRVWGKKSLRAEDYSQAVEALKATRFERFTDNFLRFNVTPGDVDWTGEAFSHVLANARLAARIAKDCGLKGLLFDVEHYNGHPFSYIRQSNHERLELEDYAQRVRIRGREFMQAFNSEFEGLTILLPLGFDLASHDPEEYRLLAPFLDGMLEAATPGTLIFDGWEWAYGYKNESQFEKARQIILERGAERTTAEVEFGRHYRASFGLWIDYSGKVWDGEDFSKNYFTPDEFEQAVRSALKYTDRYVWIYSHKANWWNGKVPQAYVDALRKARGMGDMSGKGEKGEKGGK